jgi:hypothetical protein
MAVQTVQKNSPATPKDYTAIFVRVPILLGSLAQTQKLRKSNLHLVISIWEQHSKRILPHLNLTQRLSERFNPKNRTTNVKSIEAMYLTEAQLIF